jgi:MFS family permease
MIPYATETVYTTGTMAERLAQLGKVQAALGMVQLAIFLMLGPVIDKFHPLRAGLIGIFLLCIAAVGGFVGIHGPTSFAVWVTIIGIATAVFQGASGALGPRLLPRQQYGQFCSANAIVFHVGLAVAFPMCGVLLDRTKNNSLIFLWFFCFCAVCMVLMLILYRQWKALGGDAHYTPPVTAPGAVTEVEAGSTEVAGA